MKQKKKKVVSWLVSRGVLAANLLRNMLADKEVIRVTKLFEIRKFYQKEPKINGFYSLNDLPKTKDGTLVINLDEHKLIGNHCIALYVNVDNGAYIASELKIFRKKIQNFIDNKNITTNIYRIFSNVWVLLYWIY